MDPLFLKIQEEILRTRLIDKGDHLLVGVSGGPDSVFLLHFLAQLKKKFCLRLAAAHLNHGLRAKEAGGDERFVRLLSRRLNIPFYSAKTDVRALAEKKKLSLEDAGRRARYDFFSRIAGRLRCDCAALAHTLDDQAETILMHLLRGAGLSGLCGMRGKTVRGRLQIIRPLLGIAKSEIISYLEKRSIACRTDSSNRETVYLRNKIRLHLLPFAEKFSPRLREHLSRMGRNLQDVEDFLRHKARERFLRYVRAADGNSLALPRKNAAVLPPAIRKELIREILSALRGDLRRIEHKHIQAIDDLITREGKVRCVQLPGGARVEHRDEEIFFGVKKRPQKTKPALLVKRLSIDKKTRIPRLGLVFEQKTAGRRVNFKRHSKWTEYFDAEKLKHPLFVRTRIPGDIFRPLGAGGRQKLKKFMIAEKIPVPRRDNAALVVCGREIVWVVGHRICETCKVTEQTRKVLKITARRINNSRRLNG